MCSTARVAWMMLPGKRPQSGREAAGGTGVGWKERRRVWVRGRGIFGQESMYLGYGVCAICADQEQCARAFDKHRQTDRQADRERHTHTHTHTHLHSNAHARYAPLKQGNADVWNVRWEELKAFMRVHKHDHLADGVIWCLNKLSHTRCTVHVHTRGVDKQVCG